MLVIKLLAVIGGMTLLLVVLIHLALRSVSWVKANRARAAASGAGLIAAGPGWASSDSSEPLGHSLGNWLDGLNGSGDGAGSSGGSDGGDQGDGDAGGGDGGD